MDDHGGWKHAHKVTSFSSLAEHQQEPAVPAFHACRLGEQEQQHLRCASIGARVGWLLGPFWTTGSTGCGLALEAHKT